MTTRTYVARGPEDLIALVPFLLGFHPEESVVLLTFGAPCGSFHARVDLPRGAREVRAVVGSLTGAVRTNHASTAAVLLFTADVDRSRALCATLVPALERSGAHVLDAVRVADGQWWSVLDGEEEPHLFDLSCHRFTVERVFDGHAAFHTRDELVASLRRATTPAAKEDTTRIADLADEVAARLAGSATDLDAVRAEARWLDDWLRERVLLPERTGVDAAEAARALALVQVSAMRDVACARMSRDAAPGHVRLWRALLVRAPDDLVPGVASVLAMAAWLAGDGALAWCAVDRCLALAPGHPLAQRIAQLLQRAVPPSTWRPVDPARVPLLGGLGEAS